MQTATIEEQRCKPKHCMHAYKVTNRPNGWLCTSEWVKKEIQNEYKYTYGWSEYEAIMVVNDLLEI